MRKHISHDIGELNSGLHVFLEPEDVELTSAGALLDKFNADFDPDEPSTAKPLGMVLNPELNNERIFYYDDVWVIVYRRSFRVHVIRHSRYTTGPHVAKLLYQSRQTGQIFWIATLQMSGCMFFNEEQIRIHILTHILNRDFYISDASRKDKVTI